MINNNRMSGVVFCAAAIMCVCSGSQPADFLGVGNDCNLLPYLTIIKVIGTLKISDRGNFPVFPLAVSLSEPKKASHKQCRCSIVHVCSDWSYRLTNSGETDGGAGGAAAPPGRSFRSFWAPCHHIVNFIKWSLIDIAARQCAVLWCLAL